MIASLLLCNYLGPYICTYVLVQYIEYCTICTKILHGFVVCSVCSNYVLLSALTLTTGSKLAPNYLTCW